MKHLKVSIPWKDGLHLRPAAMLVKRAREFQSTISLRVDEKMADARSILAVLLLCASFGSAVELQASGADEDAALAAISAVFDTDNSESTDSSGSAGEADDSSR